MAVETHIGSHIKETKYATKKTEVFGTKDIRTKTLPQGNPSIIPDLGTVHGFTPSKSQGPEWYSSTSKQEDTSRLDTTVTVLSRVNKTGGALLGVRFRDEDMTADVLQRKSTNKQG